MAKHGNIIRLMFAINKIKEVESFVKSRLEFLWKVVLEATFSKWDGVILRTFPPLRYPCAHVIHQITLQTPSTFILAVLHPCIVPRAEVFTSQWPPSTHFHQEPNPIRQPVHVGPRPSHLALSPDPSSLPCGSSVCQLCCERSHKKPSHSRLRAAERWRGHSDKGREREIAYVFVPVMRGREKYWAIANRSDEWFKCLYPSSSSQVHPSGSRWVEVGVELVFKIWQTVHRELCEAAEVEFRGRVRLSVQPTA